MFEPVRARRQALNVSQTRVAQAARKSLGWAQQIEAGVLVPSRADAEKVATLLGARPEELFSRIREDAPGREHA